MPIKVSQVKTDGYYYVEESKRVRRILRIEKQDGERIVHYRSRSQKAGAGFTTIPSKIEISKFAKAVDRMVWKDFDPDYN